DRAPISVFCFGCEPLGGTDWGDIDLAECENAVRHAYERGVRFFDTADVYGLGASEERLSRALAGNRFEAMIATKGGVRWSSDEGGRARTWRDLDPAYLRGAVDDSLRRLRIDSIGLYYLHWPDERTDLRETLECLAEMKLSGKIQRIGLS